MAGFGDIDGAVATDSGIAHFGDAFREQRRLAAGEAMAPLGDRTVIEVAGPERLSWLDSITSQAVTHLSPGESTELLVLDPQGRVEHAAAVIDDGASTWLIADAGDADALATWLTRMKFRTQATVEVRDDLRLIGFVDGGSSAQAASVAASAPNGVALIWSDPWQRVSAGGHQYAEVAEHPGAALAWRVAIVPADAADELGHVTSVARHFEDGPIALAILSRRAPEGDLVVRTAEGDIAAAQQVIVPADAGATADIPRITRLSRRPSAPDPRDSDASAR